MMVLSWVLLVVLAFFLVFLLSDIIWQWKDIPSMLKLFSGLNALALLVNIMCLGLTIEQQNDNSIANHYHMNQSEKFDRIDLNK